jgi:sec-independent protein translocase protein TatC
MALDQMDVDKLEFDDEGNPIIPGGEKEMSFLEHLEELRWHIIRALIAIAVTGIVLFLFQDFYFNNIILGPAHNDFISYRMFCRMSNALGLGDSLCMTLPEFQVQAVIFAEQFITAIKMCFVGGFVISFPYVFYEIWTFVAPGLYPKERRVTRGVVAICSILFLLGVSFGFFIIAPFATNFLMGYNVSDAVSNNPTLSSFVLYMVMFTLPAGIVFELPVVVYFLSRLGLVTPDTMRQYRKHSIIGILILASVLTPPDVVTQFLIGIPLYILYELSIIVSARASKQYQAEVQ